MKFIGLQKLLFKSLSYREKNSEKSLINAKVQILLVKIQYVKKKRELKDKESM